jgi:hypothetical protein
LKKVRGFFPQVRLYTLLWNPDEHSLVIVEVEGHWFGGTAAEVGSHRRNVDGQPISRTILLRHGGQGISNRKKIVVPSVY